MTRIGISLEDLGIETRSTGKPSTPKIDEYPKAYDFASELALYGSWAAVRDRMLKRLKDEGYDLGMWIAIFWTKAEGETEESIKTRLTGMTYDKEMHEAFKDNLEAWAESLSDPEIIRQAVAAIEGSGPETFLLAVAKNEHTPQDLLEKFVKDARFNYALLGNPSLTTQTIRDIYAMVKNDAAGRRATACGGAELPADIIEALAGRGYLLGWTPIGLSQQRNVTEQALLDLIGKCDESWIRSSPGCTDNVRNRLRWKGASVPWPSSNAHSSVREPRAPWLVARVAATAAGRRPSPPRR
jgi:hypothetical protein